MSPAPKSTTEHGTVTVRFWGVRGSIPVPGPQTVRYGGNTSCVEVRADGQIIILDAGSGLRPLGISLAEEFRGQPLDLTILVTHTHWDHIQGFPFFSPAYETQNRIRVGGFADVRSGLNETFAGQMVASYFPVSLSQMPGSIVFEELSDDASYIGGIRVSASRTNHPGMCYGYRLDTSAGSICYIPDHEIVATVPNSEPGGIAKLMHGADLVILDAQYTAEEYRTHTGWGHSSMEAAVRCARDMQVRRLHLFHHDPSHDDEFLDQMLKAAKDIAGGSGMHVESAREGDQFISGAGA